MTDTLVPNAINPDALFHRQHGIYNPANRPGDHVSFIGLGGIGSFAAFATAKLGVPKITLVDFDEVNVHNVPNQMHPLTVDGVPTQGHAKSDITAQMITEHMGDAVTVEAVNGKHDAIDQYDGVVVSGLDSMEARKAVWEDRIKYNVGCPLYIDARISAQLILIYCVPTPYNPEIIEQYEKTLHSDDEAEAVSCTERGIIDVGFQCGALITRMIRRHYAEERLYNATYMSMKSLMLRQWDWN